MSVTDLNTPLARAHTRKQALLGRGMSGFGINCGLRRGRPRWPFYDGLNVLCRWTGERLPSAGLAIEDARPAEIIGIAEGDATQIDVFGDVTHTPNGVEHFAVVPVSEWGAVAPLDVTQRVTRVFDGAGAPLGLMPNAPSYVTARRMPGNKPLVRWKYSAWRQQIKPVTFRVYAGVGAAGAVNLSTPAATVSWIPGRTDYEWLGDALSVGDVRHYTVRAVSAAGVLSLIPRLSGGSGPSYSSVALTDCARIEIPTPPPDDFDGIYLEPL